MSWACPYQCASIYADSLIERTIVVERATFAESTEDSNLSYLGYEPSALPLSYPASKSAVFPPASAGRHNARNAGDDAKHHPVRSDLRIIQGNHIVPREIHRSDHAAVGPHDPCLNPLARALDCDGSLTHDYPLRTFYRQSSAEESRAALKATHFSFPLPILKQSKSQVNRPRE